MAELIESIAFFSVAKIKDNTCYKVRDLSSHALGLFRPSAAEVQGYLGIFIQLYPHFFLFSLRTEVSHQRPSAITFSVKAYIMVSTK